MQCYHNSCENIYIGWDILKNMSQHFVPGNQDDPWILARSYRIKKKRFQNSGGLIFLKRNEGAPFLYDVKGESATHSDRQAAYYSQQLSQLTKLSCEAVLAPNLILFWAIKTETASKILFQNFLQYFLKKCNSFKKKTLSISSKT